MNFYKGLLFQGGFFATPESLKQLEPVEETFGVVGQKESRPAPVTAGAAFGKTAEQDCCLPA